MDTFYMYQVLMAPGLWVIHILDSFMPYLGSGDITIKTTTGCNWSIKLKDVNGKPSLDHSWPTFAIAHKLQIGYFLFFKNITLKEYIVVIFDYS
jgi:hypothetical protein